MLKNPHDYLCTQLTSSFRSAQKTPAASVGGKGETQYTTSYYFKGINKDPAGAIYIYTGC